MARWISLATAVLLIACYWTPCDGGNILFVQVYGSMSHTHSVIPALEALAVKGGHNVTILAMFVPKSKLKGNINVLHMKTSYDWLQAENPTMLHMRNLNQTFMRYFLVAIPTGVCRSAMLDDNFRRVAADRSTKYDIVIVDPLMSECAMPLIWQLGSPPFIMYCTTSLYSFTAMSLDIPTPLSYVASTFLPFSDSMSFGQRFSNLMSYLFFEAYQAFYLIPTLEGIVRQYYPDVPPLKEIERNASFVFSNSYSPALDYPRPLAPFFAEVGGIHCRPAKPLPKDIADFIEGAGKHGFVYFSLGTNVKGVDLSPALVNIFLKTFGRLKQRVIWKYEDALADLPANVRVFKWLSQQDILGHPNIKAFITQGGQLSIQEAIYHAAPIVGLPVLADQIPNVRKLVLHGMGEELDYDNLTEDSVYDVLNKMANNDSYKENCRKQSKLMQDRPMDPIDTIVYWVDYVIRHKGAHHLRLNAGKLNFFQYFLLDVIAVICASIAIAVFIVVGAVRFLLRMLFGRRRVTSKTAVRQTVKKSQ